jgi:hypothetical protein
VEKYGDSLAKSLRLRSIVGSVSIARWVTSTTGPVWKPLMRKRGSVEAAVLSFAVSSGSSTVTTLSAPSGTNTFRSGSSRNPRLRALTVYGPPARTFRRTKRPSSPATAL